ncbi:MAG: DUF805 domain-containing protein, partial [Bacteroidota bacterium]
LRQYADFEGRARRKEYWIYFLFNTIFLFLVMLMDIFLNTFPIFLLFFIAGTFIPSLAVTIRRLHDIGKSGWMYLVTIIPIIGSIWFLVLVVTDSQPGDNEYGPNPKEENSGDYFGSADTLD